MTVSEFLKWAIVFGLYPGGGGGGGGVTKAEVQQGAFNVSGDTGTDGTAYIGSLTPAPASYTDKLRVLLTPAHTSTINIPTFALNTLPAKPIISGGPFLFEAGSIEQNIPADLIFSVSEDAWILQNPVAVLQPLDAAKIFVGNSSNVASQVPMSGDGTLDDTGKLIVNGLDGHTLMFAPNEILANTSLGVPAFTATLPTNVQSNITRLGTQLVALNMGALKITNLATPTIASDAVTKAYADSIAGGLNPIPGVYAASTTDLGYTYSNGSAGVGATLTAPSTGVFTLDGTTPPVGSAILYKDDTIGSGAYNGIYIVTTSNGGSAAVLTRATYYDSPIEIQPGDWIAIENGTVNVTGSSYIQTATVTNVGSSPLTFSQFFSPANYLPLSGGTMAGSINMGGFFLSNTGGIKGSNGNLVTTFSDNVSSVNYFGFSASATGGPPLFDVTGSDPQISMNLRCKNGDFWFSDYTGTAAPAIMLFDDAGTNSVGFKSPSTLTGNSLYVLPSDFPPVDGYVLSSLMSGITSWVPNGGGGGGVSAADIQNQTYTYWLDSGTTADNYIITPSPAISSYQDGQRFSFKAANPNTGSGAETINVNGLGPVSIVTNDNNNSLLFGMILANSQYDIEYNAFSNSFSLLNPSGATSASGIQNRYYTYQYDTNTTPNVYALTIYPIPSSTNFGQQFTFIAGRTNTGPSTFNLSSQGAFAITYPDGSPLYGGEIIANTNCTVEWANFLGNWVISNPNVTLSNYVVTTKQILTPLTGDTITLDNTSPTLTILNPAGTLATLIIGLASGLSDGTKFTISTTQIITSLTFNASGNTVIAQPSSLSVGQSFSMIFNAGDTTWYPG